MHPQILLHGSTERRPDPVLLQTGSLTLQYEGGFLRYVKVGDTEVLRMINFLIRDHNWATPPMVILSEDIKETSSDFAISYRSECSLGNIKYHWDCVIRGEDDTITFEINGESRSTFKRNRIGLTILHPIGPCTGKHCTITHSTNRQEILKFPELIDPHQPFFDITEMRWNPSDSIEAFLKFEGDIFETEDQRNWSDNSYKTYSTPLARPFPVEVKPGDRIRQKVRLKVMTNKSALVKRKHLLTFDVQKQGSTSFPHIGLAWNNLSHDAEALERISSLKVDYIRIKVELKDPDLLKKLHRALQTASYLELVLFVEGKPDVSFAEKLLPITDSIKQIILLPAKGKSTQSPLIDDWVPVLRKSFPKAKIGAGADTFFTELNRERTPTNAIDFVTFSLTPQAHATDNATIVENLGTQKDIIHSCRAFVGKKSIHVGPVTLKMRKNPAATSDDDPDAGVLPPTVDPRQLSMFGAAWMLGSIKYLAENGVNAITFFETSGWKGLFPHVDEPWPEPLIDKHDEVYPVYVMLKNLLSHKQMRVVKLVSSDPLTIDGLALTDSDGRLLIYLMNFTASDQLVALPPTSRLTRAAIIDDQLMNKWIKHPEGQFIVFKETTETVSLPPYGIALLKQ